ncbi:MAG: hypothetical protein J0M08_04385 [Bacteroidetes bacterium]|nr:hypothetical protein [Bacteroidota bacterium]
MTHQKHLFLIVLFTGVVELLFYFSKQLTSQLNTNHIYIIPVFFLLLGVVSGFFLLKSLTSNSASSFVRVFMAVSVVRMFASLAVIILYLVFFKTTALGFSICFLVSYFLYLLFDIVVFSMKN